jgi:curved DNA-binding protein
VRGGEREITLQVPGEAARIIKVRIPPGVKDGGRIRLRGQGHQGGDLVLHVHVGEHPYFRRAGNDLLLSLPITIGEAYRGAKVQVPTPDGPVTLRIPERVRGGSKLRLRGKGVRHGDTAGDLIVELQIVLPASGDVAQAVQSIEDAYTEPVRKDITW